VKVSLEPCKDGQPMVNVMANNCWTFCALQETPFPAVENAGLEERFVF